jgi:hypothetical protein
MTVHPAIVNTFEVSAESKTFHLSEKFRVIRECVFERAMLLAGLPHQDASAFFQYLRFDDSRVVSEIRNICLTSEHRLHGLMVAVRA